MRFESAGVLARLDDVDSEQPGMLRVRCTGTQRFRAGRRAAQQADGLWVGAMPSCSTTTRRCRPAPSAGRTVQALANAIATLKAQGAEPFHLPHRLDDAGWVANRWCEILPISLGAKQKLMELDDPQVRLQLVRRVPARQRAWSSRPAQRASSLRTGAGRPICSACVQRRPSAPAAAARSVRPGAARTGAPAAASAAAAASSRSASARVRSVGSASPLAGPALRQLLQRCRARRIPAGSTARPRRRCCGPLHQPQPLALRQPQQRMRCAAPRLQPARLHRVGLGPAFAPGHAQRGQRAALAAPGCARLHSVAPRSIRPCV